jgi:hypothetical protein
MACLIMATDLASSGKTGKSAEIAIEVGGVHDG